MTLSDQSQVPFLSGHDIITVSVNFAAPTQHSKRVRCRNWKLVSQESIEEQLSKCGSTTGNYDLSVDGQIAELDQGILRVLDTIAPERPVKITRPPAPWFTNDIRDLQRRRNIIYRIFRRTGFAYAEYCSVRRLVKQRIMEAKKKFLQERIALVRKPKIIWNDFRRLGLLKVRTSSVLADLDLNGLNDYFASIGGGRGDKQQLIPTYFFDDSDDKFKFEPIVSEDVQRNLARITTSAVDPDGLAIRHYKLLMPYCLQPIVDMFNASLASSQFSKQWKESWVIPIPKVRSPQQFSDYRPISILCPLSKVLERCVYDQLIAYISRNNLLNLYQTGFS